MFDKRLKFLTTRYSRIKKRQCCNLRYFACKLKEHIECSLNDEFMIDIMICVVAEEEQKIVSRNVSIFFSLLYFHKYVLNILSFKDSSAMVVIVKLKQQGKMLG